MLLIAEIGAFLGGFVLVYAATYRVFERVAWRLFIKIKRRCGDVEAVEWAEERMRTNV